MSSKLESPKSKKMAGVHWLMYSDNMLGVALMISDTILPMPNLAKTAILLLKGYRLVTKYHLMTIFLPGPEVVTISDNQCIHNKV